MPYWIFASLVYITICGILVRYIARNVIMPFIELANRIRQNVEKMRKQKLKNKQEKIQNGKNSFASSSIDLSITLLEGYK